jgi:hypothetical protein
VKEFYDRSSLAAVAALGGACLVGGLIIGDLPRSFALGAAVTPLALTALGLVRTAAARRRQGTARAKGSPAQSMRRS